MDTRGQTMEGTVDEGSLLTVSKLEWVKSYLKMKGLRWSDAKVGSSEEEFRFGPGKEIWPKLKTAICC